MAHEEIAEKDEEYKDIGYMMPLAKPKTLRCLECPETFPREQSLMHHIKNEHIDAFFVCWFCQKRFSTAASIKSHMQKIHDSKMPERITTAKNSNGIKSKTGLSDSNDREADNAVTSTVAGTMAPSDSEATLTASEGEETMNVAETPKGNCNN